MERITISKIFFKSILAGICISIGCVCYLSIENKIIGSLLFSVGLYAILGYDLFLYTGTVGHIKTIVDLLFSIMIFCSNVMGCVIFYTIIKLTPIYDKIYEVASNMALAKTQIPLYQSFILGIICGILMLFATKKKKNLYFFVPMMCVSVFILIGAEHSIADAFYLIFCKDIVNYYKYVLTIALGNAVGAIITNRIINLQGEAVNEQK